MQQSNSEELDEPEVEVSTERAVQTDLTQQAIKQLELNKVQLEQDNLSRQQEIIRLTIELFTSGCGCGYPSEQQLRGDNKLVTFYTGLNNFTICMAIFEFITKGASTLDHSKLPLFACFLLTLMKLRLHSNNYDLAFRFDISDTTVNMILRKWIFCMNDMLSQFLIKWPSRDSLQSTMPFCFRLHYGLKW